MIPTLFQIRNRNIKITFELAWIRSKNFFFYIYTQRVRLHPGCMVSSLSPGEEKFYRNKIILRTVHPFYNDLNLVFDKNLNSNVIGFLSRADPSKKKKIVKTRRFEIQEKQNFVRGRWLKRNEQTPPRSGRVRPLSQNGPINASPLNARLESATSDCVQRLAWRVRACSAPISFVIIAGSSPVICNAPFASR